MCSSDLIKLSMINIYNKYKNNENIKLLLQIHDELILEVREEVLEETLNDLKEIMENVYKLNIPLKVSVATGNSWQELK